MFAKQNNPAEYKPWEFIKVKDSQYPQYLKVINPAIRIPICATEEHAIKNFTTVRRLQISIKCSTEWIN